VRFDKRQLDLRCSLILWPTAVSLKRTTPCIQQKYVHEEYWYAERMRLDKWLLDKNVYFWSIDIMDKSQTIKSKHLHTHLVLCNFSCSGVVVSAQQQCFKWIA